MAAATKNRGASKAKKSQDPVQQVEILPVGKSSRRIVPKPDLEVDYEISFWEILELLFNAEQGKYQVRNWGTETLEFEGEVPPGGYVSFHKKGSLSHIEIFRTTIGDIEKFWKGQMDVLSLRPKIYINLAALLQILDEQGTPLINTNGKKVVFHDIKTECGTIEAWQILYTKLYKGPHFTKNSQYSPLIREYWKRSGAAQIQSWDDQGMGEDDENERIMMGGETPQGGIEKPDNLKLRQLMRELDPETAKKLADVFGVEVEMSHLKGMIYEAMEEYSCTTLEEFADSLARSAPATKKHLLSLLTRIDQGGTISHNDNKNALYLLAFALKTPSGDPFEGDVQALIDFAKAHA